MAALPFAMGRIRLKRPKPNNFGKIGKPSVQHQEAQVRTNLTANAGRPETLRHSRRSFRINVQGGARGVDLL
jgi:hypothetical protein